MAKYTRYQPKLTRNLVIWKAYKLQGVTAKALSKKYGVHTTRIYKIVEAVEGGFKNAQVQAEGKS